MKKLASLFVALFSLVWLTGAGWLPLVKPAASGLPLDGITTGIKAAYSTRKLLTAYAGNTGKVITWYDQSGGGFNQTQGTIANAPIIYQSGAVNTLNSKPAILWVLANTTFLTNATLDTNPVNTLFMNAVLNISSNITAQIIGPGTSARQAWDISGLNVRITSALTAVIATSTSPIVAGTPSLVEMQYEPVGGAWNIWIDRVGAGSGTAANSFGANSQGTFLADEFGISGNANYFDGSFGELIMYDLAGGISSGNRTSIESNQHTYWGTP